jgi:polyhydroxyalkanoate synthesis regulator phasin
MYTENDKATIFSVDNAAARIYKMIELVYDKLNANKVDLSVYTSKIDELEARLDDITTIKER